MPWETDGYIYGNRKPYTVQKINIDGDLSDFPVCLYIDGDADVGAVSNADGHDLRVTEVDGSTLFDYERESFDIDAGAATGVLWTRMNLTAAAGGSGWLYYRAADTPDGSNTDGDVWDANFTAVIHMNEQGDVWTPTANSVNGGTTGVEQGTVDSVAGKIAGGGQFNDASSELIKFADNFGVLNTPFTISFCVKLNESGTERLFQIGDDAQSNQYVGIYSTAAAGEDWVYQYRAGENTPDTADFAIAKAGTPNNDTGVWVHLIAESPANNSHKIYTNGVLRDTDTNAVTSQAGFDSTGIGGEIDSDPGYASAVIDEVRVSTVARGAVWGKFEHANMFEGDHEITWGAEQTVAGPGSCYDVVSSDDPDVYELYVEGQLVVKIP